MPMTIKQGMEILQNSKFRLISLSETTFFLTVLRFFVILREIRLFIDDSQKIYSMIVYNPKDWFKTITYLHNSKIFKRLLPYLIISVLVSWALAYWELEYLKLSDRTWMKNITTVHNLLGFVLSLLLVFRTNTAYDRWWEIGRASCRERVEMWVVAVSVR